MVGVTRLAHDAQATVLRQRATGPALFGMRLQPAGGFGVMDVVAVVQGNQHVDDPSSARMSDALFVAQAVDVFVADDHAARRQGVNAERRQRVVRVFCRTGRRAVVIGQREGFARQFADDLSQRLFAAAPALWRKRQQHVVGDVEVVRMSSSF